MRIVTWNCNGAFRKKVQAIKALKPDLAIIQECESPERLRAGGLDLGPQSIAWCGDLAYKGLAVISFTHPCIETDTVRDPSLKLLLPVVVTGEQPLHLLAVWTKETENQDDCYVGQACLGVQKYATFINRYDTVVVGDFNSNQIWDRPNRRFQHADMVAQLSDFGLVSVYHHYYQEPQGHETRYTYYYHKKPDHPFCIDYCFVPRKWTPHLRSVTVGSYNDWHELSDHCPMIVDFDFNNRDATPLPNWLRSKTRLLK
jgi:exodeoxyribonuclease III